MKNTQVLLARRPVGPPVADDFSVAESDVPEPGAGEALMQNLYISLDAGFRNWMDEGAGDDVLPAMALGQPVMGLVAGKVLQSNRDDLAEGGDHLNVLQDLLLGDVVVEEAASRLELLSVGVQIRLGQCLSRQSEINQSLNLRVLTLENRIRIRVFKNK